MIEAEFSGGFVDITPDKEVGGSPYCLQGPFAGINDCLEANVILLRYKAKKLVLLSVDLFVVGHQLRETVLQHLDGLVHDSELFMVASHTHCAPNTFSRIPNLGRVDNSYIALVAQSIAGLVRRLHENKGERVTLAYAETTDSGQSINRRARRIWPRREFPFLEFVMGMNPNKYGVRDPSIRVLSVWNDDIKGSVKAILWNYACHPVCVPRNQYVSADYPGAVRAMLRRRLGANVPILFLPGFMGNLRPRIIDRSLSFKNASRALEGGRWGKFSDTAWATWVASITDDVFRALFSTNSRPLLPRLTAFRRVTPLSQFMDGETANDIVTFQIIEITEDLLIVAISAEPVVEYLPMIRQMWPGKCIIPVGYIDGVFGYLPTKRIIEEGGYEASGFRARYSLQAIFRPDLETQVLDNVKKVREQRSSAVGGR